jgi:hypothetical protein
MYHEDGNYTILCPQSIEVALLDECIYVMSFAKDNVNVLVKGLGM